MVVNIILSFMIPVTIAVTGFLTLRAVQMGLRWQVQVKQDTVPTMETREVIPSIPMPKAREEPELSATVLEEWINGPRESR